MLSFSSSGLAGGPAALAFGKDFTCNSTICYGIGAKHNVLLQLQILINKYAAAVGFGKIGVDGKIGDGTIKAFRKAAAWIKAKGGNAPFTIDGRDVSKFDNLSIAANAPALNETLDFWSTALPKAAPAPVKPPAVATAPSSPPASSGSQPGNTMTPIVIPDFNQQPSQGSFGPGTAPAAATQQPQVFTVQEPTPWWVWAVGGALLVGGVGTAVMLTKRPPPRRRVGARSITMGRG